VKDIDPKSIHRPIRVPGKRLVITRRMLETAIENTKSNSEAARWIGVSYKTYKKYAEYYDLFEQHKNQAGVGVKKGFGSYTISLEDICTGKRDNPYTLSVFKKRLIKEGYMVEECDICGWNERNIGTDVVCLTVDYTDGDHKNNSFDNVRLLCPNCYYSNNGWFMKSKAFCK